MSLGIASITFDCADALELARFWSAAFDRPIDEPTAPGEPAPSKFFASIGRTAGGGGGGAAAGPVMMFIAVPEPKSAKNRVHLDLVADERAAEVERLVGLGATVVHEKDEWGVSWVTLTDPEGNEFCVAGN